MWRPLRWHVEQRFGIDPEHALSVVDAHRGRPGFHLTPFAAAFLAFASSCGIPRGLPRVRRSLAPRPTLRDPGHGGVPRPAAAVTFALCH